MPLNPILQHFSTQLWSYLSPYPANAFASRALTNSHQLAMGMFPGIRGICRICVQFISVVMVYVFRYNAYGVSCHLVFLSAARIVEGCKPGIPDSLQQLSYV